MSDHVASLVALVAPLLVRAAEEAEEGPSELLAYGIGALTLLILVGLLVALLGFGKGREHS